VKVNSVTLKTEYFSSVSFKKEKLPEGEKPLFVSCCLIPPSVEILENLENYKKYKILKRNKNYKSRTKK
jgi:hypothetical protein